MAAAAARRVPAERPSPAAKVENMKQRIRGNVARNLVRIRGELGLTQRQLAERANVSQTYISQIEKKADRNFGLDLLVALCVALDVSFSDLTSD
jgi:DNA-binding XRE family transcriptional regulator